VFNHGKYYAYPDEDEMILDQKGETDLLRAIFDALPSLVFVVDQDVRILEYNKPASDLISVDREVILKQRTGDILFCIHSTETPGGCGTAPHCKDCVIRNSVMSAFRGNSIFRRRTRIEIIRDGTKKEIYALITVSPFIFQKESKALLVIEDISEIAELRRMIPICAVCHKVRDDNQAWGQIEAYFRNKWDVDFSHGLCPDCFKNEMDKLEQYKKAGNTHQQPT